MNSCGKTMNLCTKHDMDDAVLNPEERAVFLYPETETDKPISIKRSDITLSRWL